jgi:hypothetical protein
MKKPHVLVVVGKMGSGGKERQIVELLAGLKESDRFETTLVVAYRGGEREKEAMGLVDQTVYIPPRFPIGVFSSLLALIIQARAQNADIIHTFGGIFWDLVGLVTARALGIKNIHGGIRSSPPVFRLVNLLDAGLRCAPMQLWQTPNLA